MCEWCTYGTSERYLQNIGSLIFQKALQLISGKDVPKNIFSEFTKNLVVKQITGSITTDNYGNGEIIGLNNEHIIGISLQQSDNNSVTKVNLIPYISGTIPITGFPGEKVCFSVATGSMTML